MQCIDESNDFTLQLSFAARCLLQRIAKRHHELRQLIKTGVYSRCFACVQVRSFERFRQAIHHLSIHASVVGLGGFSDPITHAVWKTENVFIFSLNGRFFAHNG